MIIIYKIYFLDFIFIRSKVLLEKLVSFNNLRVVYLKLSFTQNAFSYKTIYNTI